MKSQETGKRDRKGYDHQCLMHYAKGFSFTVKKCWNGGGQLIKSMFPRLPPLPLHSGSQKMCWQEVHVVKIGSGYQSLI